MYINKRSLKPPALAHLLVRVDSEHATGGGTMDPVNTEKTEKTEKTETEKTEKNIQGMIEDFEKETPEEKQLADSMEKILLDDAAMMLT